MTDEELLAQLVHLAGDLFGDGGQEEIGRDLLCALRRGQTPGLIAPEATALRPWPRPETVIDSARLAQFRALVAEPDDPSRPAPLLLRRTGKMVPSIVPHAWPSWARGRRRRRTFGSLREATTRSVWFDLWDGPTSFVVHRANGAGAEPLLVLVGRPESSGGTLTLEGRDGWLSARALDPSAPADRWIALAADRIVLESDLAWTQLDQEQAIFPQASQFTLRIVPRADEPGPVGGEGAATLLKVRGEMLFGFGPGGTSAQYDSAGLRVLGLDLRLTPAGGPLQFDASTSMMDIPSSAGAGAHPLDERVSGPWMVKGHFKITNAALAFPICGPVKSPETLGAVDGGTAAWLKLDEGLVLEVSSLRDDAGEAQPVRLKQAQLLARSGDLWLAGEPGGSPCGAQRLRPGWSSGVASRSAKSEFSIAHSSLKSIEVWSSSEKDDELSEGSIRRGGKFTAALARPALATGGHLSLEGGFELTEHVSGDGTELTLRAIDLAPTEPIAFVLHNGLLRAPKLSGLTLQARLAEDGQLLEAGWLTLAISADLTVVMLADPYASDYLPWDDGTLDRQQLEPVKVIIAADWRDEEAVGEIAFGFEGLDKDPLAGDPAPREEPPEHDDRRQINQHYRRGFTESSERRRLLDVSGASDQLGLALYAEARSDEHGRRVTPLGLDGLRLTHRLDRTDLLLLPGFLNERVGNIPNPSVLPFPAMLAPLGDGGPQRLWVEVDAEVAVDPRPLARVLAEAVDTPPLRGLVSLPFGMRASILLDLANGRDRFDLVELESAERRELRAAEQWRIGSGQVPADTSSTLPGFAHQLKLGKGSDGSQHSVLGGDVHNFFNDSFSKLSTAPGQTPKVPIGSIDISGHGNSLISLWRNPGLDQDTAPSSGVSEVRFRALVGRTGLEVVQITSLCHPWCARFVRTVTIKRSASSTVWRSDSGWQSAGDARVAYQGLAEPPELGAIRRLTAITNIRETEELVQHSSSMHLRAVLFDALAELEGAERLVAVHDVKGWVEARPAPPVRPPTLSAELLKFVLTEEAGTSRGGCFGRLDTQVRMGGSDQLFHAVSLGIELGSTAPMLVGVLRGNLVMPERGSWTIGVRNASEGAYRRHAGSNTVPLTALGTTWHVREARDLSGPPGTQYALVHCSECHRLLIPDPHISAGTDRFEGGRPLQFVDQFALARAETLMPPDIDCVPLPQGSYMAISHGGHLSLEMPGTDFEVTAPAGSAWRQLVIEQTGADNQMRLEYRGTDERRARIRLEVDTRAPDGRDWAYEIGQVCITSDLPPFGRFSTASGKIKAASNEALRFDDLKIQFCDALETAQEIMDIMQSFSFPPFGGGGGTVRTEDYANAEKAHYAPLYIGREIDVPIFAKPHHDERYQLDLIKKEWVDIGCGKFMGKLGFFLRIGELQKGQHRNDGEAFFGLKFEISGRLVTPIIYPFYAGGIFKVEYEWKGPRLPAPGHFVKPEEEEHQLDLSAGVSGVASLDLKAFEAELSVSYLHVLSFEGVKSPFDKFKYGIKYILEGEVALLKIEPFGTGAGLALGFETMAIPSRAENAAGEYTDEVSVRIEAAIVLEGTLAFVCHAEYEVEAECEIKAGLPTLAAYLLGNPYLLAGELA